VVGCRSRNDRQTSKQTDKQNGMTIRLTLCERDAIFVTRGRIGGKQIFHDGGKFNVTLDCIIDRRCRICTCCRPIPDTDKPLNVFARWRQFAPELILDSLSPDESAFQTASRSVQPFLHKSRLCPTHKHTDHVMLHVRTAYSQRGLIIKVQVI